ncbi:MAG: hypothetical protein NZ554_14495, partial [Bryobacteraceae bacterium]|nr:hypothetical protein [Bryobacteraceae bacterium]
MQKGGVVSMRQIGLMAACIGMGLTLVCAAPAYADTNKKSTTAASQQTTKQPTRCPVSGKTLTDLKKAPKLTY